MHIYSFSIHALLEIMTSFLKNPRNSNRVCHKSIRSMKLQYSTIHFRSLFFSRRQLFLDLISILSRMSTWISQLTFPAYWPVLGSPLEASRQLFHSASSALPYLLAFLCSSRPKSGSGWRTFVATYCNGICGKDSWVTSWNVMQQQNWLSSTLLPSLAGWLFILHPLFS